MSENKEHDHETNDLPGEQDATAESTSDDDTIIDAPEDETASEETPSPVDLADIINESFGDEPEDTLDDDGVPEVVAEVEDVNLDIDAALASVASLDDAIAEREAEEAAELRRIEDERRQREEAQRLREEEAARRAAHYYPRPPMVRLQRGQMTSVIPALVLILVGAGLTVVLASSETSINLTTIALVASGVLGVMMIAQWMVSARWAGGALFGGSLLLFSAVTIILLANTDDPGADGWPILISAVGLSVLISALLSQPFSRYQWFAGICLIVAGGIGFVVSAGLLGDDLDSLLPVVSIVLVIAFVLLAAAPILNRSRGSR